MKELRESLRFSCNEAVVCLMGRRKIQADILGIPVQRPTQLETTALGAAYLAGIGVGVLKGTTEVSRNQEIERTFESTMRPRGRRARLARWEQAVAKSKQWADQ